jgi:RimJ/RimL family protein N-acetyltransferase
VILAGDGWRLRSATEADIPWLVSLAARPEVADFLAAVSPWTETDVRASLAADPHDEGRLVIEVEEEGGPRRAGAVAFSLANRRSRIAYLFGLMVDPAFRGRGLAGGAMRVLAVHLIRELGYHRIQFEVYGFNERALRLFERTGFVPEGRRRLAYARHRGWVDGVLFGLVEEDLDAPPGRI